MKLGIVILNYNDAERSTALAEKVSGYVAIDEVCVVDNASTDGSWETLRMRLGHSSSEGNGGETSQDQSEAKENRKEDRGDREETQEDKRGSRDTRKTEPGKIHLLQSGENRGYAAGNNIGCRYLMDQCGCDILLIANPDVDFPEETVTAIRKGFADYPEYGVLGPLMKNPDGTVSDRPYLQIPTFWQGVGLCFYTYNRRYERKHPYVLKASVPKDENADGSSAAESIGADSAEKRSSKAGSAEGSRIMTVDAVQGSMWAVRADVFRRTGGLDEGTFLFYEEMSFALRMREKCPEYREGLLLDVSYFHNHSASIRNSLSQMRTFRVYMQSKLYFEKTYHHATRFRYAILKLATLISRLEERLYLLIRRT